MKQRFLLALALSLAGLFPVSAQTSLWILDPNVSWNWKVGSIAEASLSVHPKGIYAEYGLYLTFSAANTYFDPEKQLEAVYDFDLPAGAIVLDEWLWVGKDIVQGKLIDRWSASQIYEGIVNRRRDPSVLYKNSATHYQLRVYPMKIKDTRKVKITYLMPVEWMKGKISASLPSSLLRSSPWLPDLFVFQWEEKGFVNPAFSDPKIQFESRTDSVFGSYKWAKVPAGKLGENPCIILDAPVQNGVYLSFFEGDNAKYYQMALNPATFVTQAQASKIVILVDLEPGNTTVSNAELFNALKQRLLATYGPNDSFNLIFSRLSVQQAFTTWKPVTSENLDAAFDPLTTGSLYSNLPGIFSSAFDFLKSGGSEGSILLLTNSDNFGNYETANNLIRDLKAISNPLPSIYIADVQDILYTSYYIGGRYYYGQEYLYVNLSKASGGDYKNIRDQRVLSSLYSDVLSSSLGMITAFDLYTAPTDGFCYGRFGTNIVEGLPLNQTVTQVGKYIGKAPFQISITGLYQNQPFSQLIQASGDNASPADTMVSKMWHGRYIGELEKTNRNNMIDQEILYESLNNRILSLNSAFLCLEPSDTVSVCKTCQDESRLVGIDDGIFPDSAGFVTIYPNPFRDRITIEVALAQVAAGEVEIKIYNLAGQLVFEKREESGGQPSVSVIWQGTSVSGEMVPAGQYILMVRAGEYAVSKQIIKSE